jgi:hypothetical protein
MHEDLSSNPVSPKNSPQNNKNKNFEKNAIPMSYP